MTDTPISVFVSHAEADATLAELVVELLTIGMGLARNCIFAYKADALGVPGGTDLVAYIRGAIESTRIGILLLSDDWLASSACQFEGGALWYKPDCVVVPVLLLPDMMSRLPRFMRNVSAGPASCETTWLSLKALADKEFASKAAQKHWAERLSALLDHARAYTRRPAQSAPIVWRQDLDTAELLRRLTTTSRGLRVWTTWAPVLCSSSALPLSPTVRVPGCFEELLQALRDRSHSPLNPQLRIQILLQTPYGRAAERRAAELPVNFQAMMLENYRNAKTLLASFAPPSRISIEVHYSPCMPAFSYYQVEDYIDLGFFPPKVDSSSAGRFVLSRPESDPLQAAERSSLVELFKSAFNDFDDSFSIGHSKISSAFRKLAKQLEGDQ